MLVAATIDGPPAENAPRRDRPVRGPPLRGGRISGGPRLQRRDKRAVKVGGLIGVELV